jgi:hypothetical protein
MTEHDRSLELATPYSAIEEIVKLREETDKVERMILTMYKDHLGTLALVEERYEHRINSLLREAETLKTSLQSLTTDIKRKVNRITYLENWLTKITGLHERNSEAIAVAFKALKGD